MSCTVEGCDRAPTKRGMCQTHYLRWWRHGDPLSGGTSKKAAQSFLDAASQYAGSDCLIWPYSTNRHGYGQIRINGKSHLVSRLVCESVNGAPPTPKHESAHSCGNGHIGCVSPEHLRWATRAENRQDMIDHGRSQRGRKSHFATLDEPAVREIRSLLGNVPQRSIAKKFGVTQSAITAIATGKSWSWMEA